MPANARAVTTTFGSELSAHSSNSNVTCGDLNVFQYAGRVGCSIYTTGNASNPADTSATHVIPFPDPRVHGDQHGTITQVAFKPALGAPSGSARLSVAEYVRDADSSKDPGLVQDIADSANFMMSPGADGIVRVATDLPARSLYDPDDNSYRFDALVLSMLDNSTPIPADLGSSFLSGWISPYVDIPSSNGELTAPLPANRQGTGCCGFGPYPFYAVGAWPTLGEVLMQAELTIPGPPPPPSAAGRAVRIDKPRLRRDAVVLPLACTLDAACRGLLQLLRPAKAKRNGASISRGNRRRRSRAKRVYGRARFSIPAHGRKRVKVKLTRAGKNMLRRSEHRRKPVRMVARVKVGTQVTAVKVRLRASGRRRESAR